MPNPPESFAKPGDFFEMLTPLQRMQCSDCNSLRSAVFVGKVAASHAPPEVPPEGGCSSQAPKRLRHGVQLHG